MKSARRCRSEPRSTRGRAARQGARDPGAGGDAEGVVGSAELGSGDVHADLDAVAEPDALGHELLEATLDQALLDLELRHAEANEPAGSLVALEDGDRMTGTCELLRAGEAGWA